MTVAERGTRRLTMRSIIVLTFQLISENIRLFSALSVIPAIPSLVLRYEQIISGEMLSASHLISYLTYILFSFLLMAAVAKAVVLTTTGYRASLQACIAEMVRDIFAVVPLAIISAFVTVVAVIVSPIYPAALILLIPGFYISVFLAVVVPVRSIERTDFIATLSRSMELTKGHRWPILAFLVLFTILAITYEGLIYVALDGPALAESTSAVTQLLLLSFGDCANAVINAVAASVIYFQLRLIKGGVPPESVATEFD